MNTDGYIPSTRRDELGRLWVAEHVELYEGSGGTEGTTSNEGLPYIVLTHRGWKTGAIRKTPLMKVADGNNYILVGSMGGAPKHPLWYHNLKANPNVEIRDRTELYQMRVREVTDTVERKRVWKIAVEAFPPYQEYQRRTSRVIPVFVAGSI